jgi:hypothetical protein
VKGLDTGLTLNLSYIGGVPSFQIAAWLKEIKLTQIGGANNKPNDHSSHSFPIYYIFFSQTSVKLQSFSTISIF